MSFIAVGLNRRGREGQNALMGCVRTNSMTELTQEKTEANGQETKDKPAQLTRPRSDINLTFWGEKNLGGARRRKE